MLSNGLRRQFYKLHSGNGAARLIADSASWAFMTGVKLLRIPPPFDLTPLTVISHRHQFIYIGIPKVATRSFRDFFVSDAAVELEIEVVETHSKYQEILSKYSDYYKFSFVRNPLDRILSCYNSKIGHDDLSLLKRARIMSFYKGLRAGMDFDEFAEWLCSNEGRDECADRHWMSQHRFLHDQNGAPLCDFVGRYETLDKDVDKVCKTLNIKPISLPQSGWISPEKPVISTRTATLLRKRYVQDYKLFGYAD